tara:strand:- start:96 stop:533 length:438 start_codon:yes stop_codon:yes gene_type:complete
MKSWVLFSLISGVFMGIGDSINKYVIQARSDIIKLLFYKFLFSTIIMFFVILVNKKKNTFDAFSLRGDTLYLVLLGSFITVFLVYSAFRGVYESPNVGYSSSLRTGMGISVGFIFSYFYFTKNIKFKELISMLFILAGIMGLMLT